MEQIPPIHRQDRELFKSSDTIYCCTYDCGKLKTSGISLRKVLNFYIKGEVVRRQDKKISDPNLIERVIQKGTVVHIAMMDGDKPYQIPLNYGYKDNQFYIHSAREGKKIDLLRANNLVHFQIETGVEVKILTKRTGVVQITNV